MASSPERRHASERKAGLAVVVLAGGRSQRMGGRDKALLRISGKSFVSRIAEEMSGIAEVLFVVIGKKDPAPFREALGQSACILNDEHDFADPTGGMLTAFDHATSEYAAVIACDLPLAKRSIIELLYREAQGRSAAIPTWDGGRLEPLCAVYRVDDGRRAILRAVQEGKVGPRNMIHYLEDARMVPEPELRAVDPSLESFFNANTEDDLRALSGIDGRDAAGRVPPRP
jgi:molybdenum cofactor guanylyltransferase